jgi:hypothetical protein
MFKVVGNEGRVLGSGTLDVSDAGSWFLLSGQPPAFPCCSRRQSYESRVLTLHYGRHNYICKTTMILPWTDEEFETEQRHNAIHIGSSPGAERISRVYYTGS